MRLFLFLFLFFSNLHAENNNTYQHNISKYDIVELNRTHENIRTEFNRKLSCVNKTIPSQEMALNTFKETLLNNHKSYQNNFTVLLYVIAAVAFLFILIGLAFGIYQKKELITVRTQYEKELEYFRNMFTELSKNSNLSIAHSRTDFLTMQEELRNSKISFDEYKKTELAEVQSFYRKTIKEYQKEKKILDNSISVIEKLEADLELSKNSIDIKLSEYENIKSEIASISAKTILQEEKIIQIIETIMLDNINRILPDKKLKALIKKFLKELEK